MIGYHKFTAVFLLMIFTASCGKTETTKETKDKSVVVWESQKSKWDLSTLKLPSGFKVEIYAEEVENARSMVMSSGGVLYVSSRHADNLYALVDEDGDHKAEKRYLLASDLNTPNGIAIKDGDLYVAEINKLTRYDDIDQKLEDLGEGVIIYEDYPRDREHGWKYIAFGPEGKLYVPVGAPCNICESRNEIYASITRMNPDGSEREVYAKGVRNTVGFTWDESGNLWFTDNGRDMLGDNMPPCELNKAIKAGQHFGYPYCHGGEIGDPEFGYKYPCSDFVKPARKLGAHVAPLGLKFYHGDMFPNDYKGSLFIAEHGSWNRSKKSGYRIMQVKVEHGKAVSYEVFLEGWLNHGLQEAWGRPVDILVLKDGSMLISDDKAGIIYRITYQKK